MFSCPIDTEHYSSKIHLNYDSKAAPLRNDNKGLHMDTDIEKLNVSKYKRNIYYNGEKYDRL